MSRPPLLVGLGPLRVLSVSTVCLLAIGCSRSSSSSGGGVTPTTEPRLLGVEEGRLVDLYGTAEDGSLQPFRRDAVVGRVAPPADGAWRELGTHPTTWTPRLVVRAPVGTPRFEAAIRTLESARRPLGASDPLFADGALRLTFDQSVDDRVDGRARLETTSGADELVAHARVAARGHVVIVDPLLSANEADRLAVRTQPIGLAAGRTWTLNVDGLPTTRVPVTSAGNDERPPQTATTGLDGSALQLMGRLPFYLERVDSISPTTQRITLYKNDIAHDIDLADGVELFVSPGSPPIVVTEVLTEPADDDGMPAVQHVRAIVEGSPGLLALDPRNLPGYPANPQSPAGEAWLVQNAPLATVVAPFQGQRTGSVGAYGDDVRFFVDFVPDPLGGSALTKHDDVSPFAGAVVRFNKPVDVSTVRPLDTLFFATRPLLDPADGAAFAQARGIQFNVFNVAKYRTPHLVQARAFDLAGDGTVWRLQTPLGFYLDDAMRQADEPLPFSQKQFRYWLNLQSGTDGLRSADGNGLDLGFSLAPRDWLAVPFALDTRSDPSGAPRFADNLVANVVRRFESTDEDEQPSYYRPTETQQTAQLTPQNFPLNDIFGGVFEVQGQLNARPTSRTRQVVDNLNQVPPPPQSSPLRFCPEQLGGESQVALPTAATTFGQPVQNPLNPLGARLQTVWREIDMSLSRVDPFDFNLEVERLYAGLFQSAPTTFDVFERTSLFLGHSEFRPEPCVGAFSALPTFSNSGLGGVFDDNYARNFDTQGNVESRPAPHPGFVDQRLVIDPTTQIREPQGVNRFSPLPALQEPYFVYRDETLAVQGGVSGRGSDVRNAVREYEPYIIAPGRQGAGRGIAQDGGGSLLFLTEGWQNARNFDLTNTTRRDRLTDGLLGATALPLLTDFWIYPNTEPSFELEPSRIGANGWQVSLAVASSPRPYFRALSAGGQTGSGQVLVSPASPAWARASGGFTPLGQRTTPADNAVMWTMIDFMKRRSVATFGFVDLFDPHRMPAGQIVDPRLGPYAGGAILANQRATFVSDVVASPGPQPTGTSVEVEFCAAGAVDSQPWRAAQIINNQNVPDATNFPLDPQKAIDAHLRKFDDRPVNGTPRNWWTHHYNRNLTEWTADANMLMDPGFTGRFAGPNESFTPEDVRYVGARLLMRNDPISGSQPSIDSWALVYRFEQR